MLKKIAITIIFHCFRKKRSSLGKLFQIQTEKDLQFILQFFFLSILNKLLISQHIIPTSFQQSFQSFHQQIVKKLITELYLNLKKLKTLPLYKFI